MLIITCPHCGGSVVIDQINCGIFRHGILKATGEQIPPHLPKQLCDHLIATNQVLGCCKPFAVDAITQDVSVCDYI